MRDYIYPLDTDEMIFVTELIDRIENDMEGEVEKSGKSGWANKFLEFYYDLASVRTMPIGPVLKP